MKHILFALAMTALVGCDIHISGPGGSQHQFGGSVHPATDCTEQKVTVESSGGSTSCHTPDLNDIERVEMIGDKLYFVFNEVNDEPVVLSNVIFKKKTIWDSDDPTLRQLTCFPVPASDVAFGRNAYRCDLPYQTGDSLSDEYFLDGFKAATTDCFAVTQFRAKWEDDRCSAYPSYLSKVRLSGSEVPRVSPKF